MVLVKGPETERRGPTDRDLQIRLGPSVGDVQSRTDPSPRTVLVPVVPDQSDCSGTRSTDPEGFKGDWFYPTLVVEPTPTRVPTLGYRHVGSDPRPGQE